MLGCWLVRRVDAGQPLALAIAELLDRFPILVDATDAPGQRPAVRELRRLDAYQDAVANLERYYHRERKRMGWPAGTNGGQRRDQ